MKAVYIKDLEVYLATFPYGEYYLDDQLLTKQPREIELKTLTGITRKETTNVFSHWQNKICGNEITNEEYHQLLKGLHPDEDGEHETIEDHYAYKEVRDAWTRHTKDVVKFLDVEIEVDKVVCNTSSKYIQNGFFVGGDPKVYTYNRGGCAWDTVRETFKECGMSFGGKVDYGKTKNIKIWGGDSLRFIVAFGSYLDLESYEGTRRGTLDTLQVYLKSDVEEIQNIIRTKYKLHFSDVSLKAEEIYKDVESILNRVRGLDVKRKSDSDRSGLVRQIIGLKEKLDLQIEESTNA